MTEKQGEEIIALLQSIEKYLAHIVGFITKLKLPGWLTK